MRSEFTGTSQPLVFSHLKIKHLLFPNLMNNRSWLFKEIGISFEDLLSEVIQGLLKTLIYRLELFQLKAGDFLDITNVCRYVWTVNFLPCNRHDGQTASSVILSL